MFTEDAAEIFLDTFHLWRGDSQAVISMQAMSLLDFEKEICIASWVVKVVDMASNQSQSSILLFEF